MAAVLHLPPNPVPIVPTTVLTQDSPTLFSCEICPEIGGGPYMGARSDIDYSPL